MGRRARPRRCLWQARSWPRGSPRASRPVRGSSSSREFAAPFSSLENHARLLDEHGVALTVLADEQDVERGRSASVAIQVDADEGVPPLIRNPIGELPARLDPAGAVVHVIVVAVEVLVEMKALRPAGHDGGRPGESNLARDVLRGALQLLASPVSEIRRNADRERDPHDRDHDRELDEREASTVAYRHGTSRETHWPGR